ncbi:hypothetical protein ACOXVJ_27555 [Pseudomonas knackmussii]|uniref:hypothetical protein n=1 Tax=Pseudomonas knackmussii TaxID=65741 RepID=UPI00136375DD|nr:hypothetical protein [Pseudomonas knackmussii]
MSNEIRPLFFCMHAKAVHLQKGLHKHALRNYRRLYYADVLDSASMPEGEAP